MIIKLSAKNQRRLFDDDIQRLHSKQPMHYSIGQHVSLLIDRVAALEAQAIEARRAETGTGSVHESAVAESDAPQVVIPADKDPDAWLDPDAPLREE